MLSKHTHTFFAGCKNILLFILTPLTPDSLLPLLIRAKPKKKMLPVNIIWATVTLLTNPNEY